MQNRKNEILMEKLTYHTHRDIMVYHTTDERRKVKHTKHERSHLALDGQSGAHTNAKS